MKVDIGYLSHRGLVRTNNEDNFLINQNINLFIIADGLGGHQGGEIASRLAVDIISEFVEEKISKNNGCDYQEVFKAGYEKANTEILKRGYELHQTQLMGTTATSLLLLEDRYFISHTGDSRAYLIRNKEITQITKDHTRLQEMIDEDGISANFIFDRNFYGSILTYCIGYDEKLKVDFYEGELLDGDYLLLCTDGLSDYVDEKDICTQFSLKINPEDICKSLLELALESGGHDNITVIVVGISV